MYLQPHLLYTCSYMPEREREKREKSSVFTALLWQSESVRNMRKWQRGSNPLSSVQHLSLEKTAYCGSYPGCHQQPAHVKKASSRLAVSARQLHLLLLREALYLPYAVKCDSINRCSHFSCAAFFSSERNLREGVKLHSGLHVCS